MKTLNGKRICLQKQCWISLVIKQDSFALSFIEKPCANRAFGGGVCANTFHKVWRQSSHDTLLRQPKCSGSPNKAQPVWIYRYAGKPKLWQWEPVVNAGRRAKLFFATLFVLMGLCVMRERVTLSPFLYAPALNRALHNINVNPLRRVFHFLTDMLFIMQ